MVGLRTSYIVTLLSCGSYLVNIIRSLDLQNTLATRSDIVIRESSRKIREGMCEDIIQKFDDTDLQSPTGFLADATPANAHDYCLANHLCNSYFVYANMVLYAERKNETLVTAADATTFVIKVRCPWHSRCSNLRCQNGGTCIAIKGGMDNECICGEPWIGLYCEHRLSCRDEPCVGGATCRNSTTAGFICTCPAFTMGTRCEVRIETNSFTVDTINAAELAVTTPNKTVTTVTELSVTTPNTTVVTTVTDLAVTTPNKTVTTVTQVAVTTPNKTVTTVTQVAVTTPNKTVTTVTEVAETIPNKTAV